MQVSNQTRPYEYNHGETDALIERWNNDLIDQFNKGHGLSQKEIRENLGINAKDLLEIYVEGNKIVLTKHNDSCLFCSTEDDLVNFDGHKICKSCLAKLAKLNEA